MLIQNKALTIRNACESDAETLVRWWNDGKVMAHAGFPNGLGTTADRVAQQLSKDSDSDGRRLIIELDGAPIGEMSYRRRDGSTAEIGIKICDFAKQEKGYGRILLCMLIKELFEMGFERIILDTDLANRRAQHVYEKIGFTRLGVNIDAWKNQLGESRSSVDYQMNKGELIDLS